MATLLVVDDDPSIRRLLEIVLADAGHDIVTADDGVMALEVLEEHDEIAIMLLDVMMPRLDGFGVMSRVRGDQRWETLPVIMLTALAGPENEKAGYDAGVNGFITKPFDPDLLTSLVNVTLSTSGYRPAGVKVAPPDMNTWE